MGKAGKVYLVGAGPGDPDLITWKGLNLLRRCDAVIYDRLVSDQLLDYVKEDCEKVYVGKTVGNHSFRQEEINQIILEKAQQYQLVVRLKGGDPFVFGRGGEEITALKEHAIPFEVIPGVTSAIAAAAYAGIPITHRGISQSFHVITGHTAEGDGCGISRDIENLAQLDGTIVILMGIGNLEEIRNVLLTKGKPSDTPVAVISNATTLRQQEVRGTLENISERIKEAGIQAPAVIVIGQVANLDMKSTIQYPLAGVRVGITGTKQMKDKLSSKLTELGARVEIVSSLRVEECKHNIDYKSTIDSIEQYQWLVFSSTNAVHIFFDLLKERAIDLRRLANIRFAVVGSGTRQALEERGYLADLIPEHFTVKDLAMELSKVTGEDDKLLIPRAREGSPEMTEILDQSNIRYDELIIYEVKWDELDQDHRKERLSHIDYLTFASSSGVHGLFRGGNLMPEDLPAQIRIVCIGEATETALKEYHYDNAVIAEECSVEGLTECILKDFVLRKMIER